MDTQRRFPPPWEVHEHDESFSIRDANGFRLAWVYFDAKATGSASRNDTLTKDEARRIAAGIARLPALLGRD